MKQEEQKPSVLFVELWLNPTHGGMERVTYNIAKQLTQRGYKCYACCIEEKDLKTTYKEAFQGVVHCAPSKETDFENVAQLIASHNITHIINQGGGSPLLIEFSNQLKLRTKTKLLSFIHMSPTASYEVLHYRNWSFPKYVFRSILKEIMYTFYDLNRKKMKRAFEVSDKVVLLTKKSLMTYAELIGVPSDNKRLAYIYNMTTYASPSYELLEQKKKTMLVVARMGEQVKRISFVLKTWKRLQDTLKDWNLTLVGDGTDLESYKAMAKRLQLQRTEFTGYASPEQYYQEASILLMTSSTEGFGMTIVEAQQFGCVPIVMDSIISAPEIIQDGVNGFITPSGDIDTFQHQIQDLAVNDARREAIARKAMDSTTRFSPNAIIPQWEKLLNE